MKYNLEKWKKEFLIIWSGQAVSILTSSIIQMAIIWYLTDKTKSAAILSFATFIGFLPQAILGSFAGVFIDRYDRKSIMIISDGAIALLTFSLVVVGFLGEIPIWFIMVILFGRSVGSAFHNPSLLAITPLIVPKEKLTQYAGYSQSFESISYLISPAIAALLYSLWDLHIIVLIDVIGAAFAIFMLLFVKVPNTNKSETQKENKSYFYEFKEGISVLKTEPGMWALLLISGLYAMIYFPIGTLYPLITMTHFKGTFVDSSIVEIIFSLGSLIGAFLLGLIGNKIKRIRAISKSIGIYGIGLIIAGILPSNGFKVFVILSLIMGASVPFYSGVQTSIFQMKFKSEYLGRVLSLSSSLTMFAMPLGLILSGLFVDIIGISNWFFISGIATVIISFFSMMMPSLKKYY
ncbi:MFS transporter [Clostridioides sp. ZZV15-6598]|uniref:MFS transporter n=1 Tax=Clostridioides sp. ZZV15-6598 TaxID=2811501 RepID=UPI001D0FA189|nr:MFS transporter [Clostridioides sp. ZZV15-6598]